MALPIEKHKELLYTLGLHEEFTPYVIFALKNGTIRENDQIWRLAKSVHGWGIFWRSNN